MRGFRLKAFTRTDIRDAIDLEPFDWPNDVDRTDLIEIRDDKGPFLVTPAVAALLIAMRAGDGEGREEEVDAAVHAAIEEAKRVWGAELAEQRKPYDVDEAIRRETLAHLAPDEISLEDDYDR